MSAPQTSAHVTPESQAELTLAPSHTLDVSPEGDIDTLALPARPGVAVFRDLTGRAAMIATTADLRALARRRLGLETDTPAAEQGAVPASRPAPPRTDHRAVMRRIEAHVTGSSLESDVLYLALARQLLPEVYRKVRDHFEAWVVHADLDARFPEWSRHALTSSSPLPTRGTLLGPFLDREAASRFIAGAIDAFDLCREQSLLVQAPAARACPYKDMGRCPAPCDGTEPLVSYQTRFRRAAEVLRTGLGSVRDRLEADMRAAAAAMEFELAAELKVQFDRLKALATPALAHAVDLRRWRAVIVLPIRPTRQPPAARVLLLNAGLLSVLGECSLEDAAAADRLAIASRAIEAAPLDLVLSPQTADTLGVLTRWLHTPATRRRGELLSVAPLVTRESLSADLLRVGRAAVKRRGGDDPEQFFEREASMPAS